MSEQDDDIVEVIREAAEALGMKMGPVIIPTPEMQQAAADRLDLQEQMIGEASGVVPRALVEFNPRSRENNNRWSDKQTDPLWLLTRDEFDMVPDGTVLVGISGQRKTKGVHYIDQDTRAGYIAWGLLDSQLPAVSS